MQSTKYTTLDASGAWETLIPVSSSRIGRRGTAPCENHWRKKSESDLGIVSQG